MTHVTRRAFLAGAAGFVATQMAPAWGTPKGGSAVAKFDPERFIEDVKRARQETDSQKAVGEVLARAVSEPGAVLLGLGEPKEAGIHTLYQADDLTILNVVWAPLMVLYPHEHRMWATIGIYTGREDNTLWERRGHGIEAASAASLSEKEVFPLADVAVHSVTNPIERLTGAIHIYGGDFFETKRSEWNPETLQERPMDIEAARRLFQEANRRYQAGR
jgi:predicted metal-dependent enzyme (double-stranded beta helix superfamily)